ncbi:SCP2 sterol-binding domain-containing protein [Effusibacillus lacus]|uniref:Sterol carrier protein n=1 Tax=Effusibacillus lacus TaxID=1348429 RepID=A0A292YNJ9_9BACL|nr:SCP2 sterol-binding domain-containing protein [Effusibacillus lacus]TCS72055.1 putative sterol carrier protein [Effusibacillus lacus]GAX90343.1 sterol carrier protein [Effusibacillus lacus]
MAVKEAVTAMVEKMNANPEGIVNTNVVYQFDLTGTEAGSFQLKFENGKVEYLEGVVEEPKCTLQMSDESFLKFAAGNFNPTMAFMTGKLKIEGSMGYAMKLSSILDNYK